jgi:hypothetical protein
MLYSPRVFFLLCVLLTPGCTVDTTEPLSDPATAKPDESLYGHWISKSEGPGKTGEDHAFIGKHTTQGNPRGIIEVARVDWEPAGNKVYQPPRIYLTVSRIGETSYMNLFYAKGGADLSLDAKGSYEQWKKDPMRRCMILRYRCDGKTLQIWTARKAEDQLRDLSKAGELKLVGDPTTVTADSLHRYLQKNGGEQLFNDPMPVYRKVP